jgi:hypothetical protein
VMGKSGCSRNSLARPKVEFPNESPQVKHPSSHNTYHVLEQSVGSWLDPSGRLMPTRCVPVGHRNAHPESSSLSPKKPIDSFD